MSLKALIKGLLSEAVYVLGLPIMNVPNRVLLYHRVVPEPRTGDMWSVSVEQFRAQMAEVRRLGYHTRRFEDLRDLRSPQNPRTRAVLIAFDDGYRSVLEHALPILRMHGQQATFFLVPAAMGGVSHWEAGMGLEPSQIMTWTEAMQLAKAGMSIGSHSLRHPDLSKLTKEEILEEVCRSKAEIETRLRVPVRGFSVPFGRENKCLDECLLNAGYRYKVGNELISPGWEKDILCLPCTPVLGRDSLREFKKKLTGSYDWLNYYQRWRAGLKEQGAIA